MMEHLPKLKLAATLGFVAALGCGGSQSEANLAATDLGAMSLLGERADCSISATELFKPIPLGTRWAALPSATRRRLLAVASQELGSYNDQWAERGLRIKRLLLQSYPTDAMKQAFDEFVAASFTNQVPAGFKATTDVKSPALLACLKDLFLAKVAESRALSQFYGGTSKDWDGTENHSFPLPSPEATQAAKRLAGDAATRLASIADASLTDVEKAIKPRLAVRLESLATGSFGGAGLGGDDLLTPYGRAYWGNDLLYSNTPSEGDLFKGRPDDYVRTAVAYWLAPTLERVNAGTVDSTENYVMAANESPEVIQDALGDPATNEHAKIFTLLSQWYLEQLKARSDATQAGYDLSTTDQNTMWSSFEADNLVPMSSRQTIAEFEASMQALVSSQTAHYKVVAGNALNAVFPVGSSALTDTARAQVLAAIDAQPTFGTLLGAITSELDSATGDVQASTAFSLALSSLGTLGGYDSGSAVKPEEEAKVQTMWQEIKDYLKRHYSGGTVDIASQLQDQMLVSTSAPTSTDNNGVIILGLGPATNITDVYSLMLHEAKHSIDRRSGRASAIEGSAWEGAAKLVEIRIAPKFLAERFADDPESAALAPLSLLATDLRYAARTEATLAAITAPTGQGLAACKQVAQKWGLTEVQTETLTQRAFFGTQYTTYLGGMLLYSNLIDYLQQQVNPPAGITIDPFLLQAYGLETAGEDAATVAALKLALGVN